MDCVGERLGGARDGDVDPPVRVDRRVGLIRIAVVPAMATTLVGFVGVRLAVTYWVRVHFEAPLRASEAFNGSNVGVQGSSAGLSITAFPPNIPNAWPLSAELVDKAGNAPSASFLRSACPGLAGPVQQVGRVGGGRHTQPVAGGSMHTCVANVAAKFHEVVIYQPASRYWPFQIYETALFALVALALAGLSIWWVRHRLN